MPDLIQHRRDTAADWASVNPILADGEIGFEHDTGWFKFGNGSTPWKSLPYVGVPHWINVVQYGADPTGVADSTSAFQAAIAALPASGGLIYAPSGNYLISGLLSFAQNQGMTGDGINVTVLSYTGSGTCIQSGATVSVTGAPTPVFFERFTIDGTSAGTNAIGFQVGDLYYSRVDICVQNFLGSGAMGMYFKNTGAVPDAEKLRVRADLYHNMNAAVFDCSSTPSSFDYGWYDFAVIGLTNQNGVMLQNGITVDGCHFSMRGNFAAQGVSSNTGVAFGFDVTGSGGSSMRDADLAISVEPDGTGVAHTSLVLGSSSSVLTYTGNMVFVTPPGGHTPFQGATITAGARLSYLGRVNDVNLGTMVLGDAAATKGGTQIAIWGSSTTAAPSTVTPQLGDIQAFLLPNTSWAPTFSGPYTRARSMKIFLYQPASGATCVPTWPSNFKFMQGRQTLSTVNGAVDELDMMYMPDVDTWYVRIRNTFIAASQVAYNEYIGSTSSTQGVTNATVPSGITGALVTMIGTGGAGGSGAVEPSGTVACGGGGGSGAGAIYDFFVPPDAFGSTFSVSLPIAPAGGAAQTTNSSNGNTGATGSSASFTTGSFALYAQSGSPGAGGTTTTGTGGSAPGGMVSGAAGASASTSGGVGGSGAGTSGGQCGGGGAGGGLATTPAAVNGGHGGGNGLFSTSSGPAGGVAGGAAPSGGSAAVPAVGGAGAGGGASATSGAAQAGASANGYGGGAGGGGAAANGQSGSGAGGTGGVAYFMIKWLYN